MGGTYDIAAVKKSLKQKENLYKSNREIKTQIDAITKSIAEVTPEITVKTTSGDKKISDYNPVKLATEKLEKAKTALQSAKENYDKIHKYAKKIYKMYKKLQDAITKADKIGKIPKKSKK